MSVKLPQPVERYDIDKLERFIFNIYNHTNGEYPLFEWSKKKPPLNDFTEFHRIYYPFLKNRLEHEFDKIYIWENRDIIATVALVFNISSKNIPWADTLRNKENAALIEFLMVTPNLQKKGIGRYVLEFALHKCTEINKTAYVITSPDLESYGFYLAMRFKTKETNPPFAILSRKND